MIFASWFEVYASTRESTCKGLSVYGKAKAHITCSYVGMRIAIASKNLPVYFKHVHHGERDEISKREWKRAIREERGGARKKDDQTIRLYNIDCPPFNLNDI